MPSINDILNHGLLGSLQRDKKKTELVNLLTKKRNRDDELSGDLQLRNASELGPELPYLTEKLTPEDEVAMAIAYDVLGINPNTQALADEAVSRTAGNTVRNRMLEKGEQATNDPIMLMNAGNKLSVSPRFKANENTVLDQYSGEIVQETPLGTARTAKTSQEAFGIGLRNDALSDVLDTVTNDAMKANIANKNSVVHTGRAKVVDKNGIPRYADYSVGLDGRARYSIATDSETGEPLKAYNSSSSGRSHRLDKSKKTIELEAWDAALKQVHDERKLARKLGEKYDNDYSTRALKVYRDRLNDPTALAPGMSEDPSISEDPGIASPSSTDIEPENDPNITSARIRAHNDGFGDLGQWIPGKGFEVYENGKLIGYYY
ncbi:MAG: hypothetical protein OEZ43_21065 [Gammaproteobacteria bacterium]|nr:hypothetical protein [Gammaproteobacteria bacterium]